VSHNREETDGFDGLIADLCAIKKFIETTLNKNNRKIKGQKMFFQVAINYGAVGISRELVQVVRIREQDWDWTTTN
jgi:hypothetical protein